MPQLFFRSGLSEELVRSMTLWEAWEARESFASGLSGSAMMQPFKPESRAG